jgi:hypothetical protein
LFKHSAQELKAEMAHNFTDFALTVLVRASEKPSRRAQNANDPIIINSPKHHQSV